MIENDARQTLGAQLKLWADALIESVPGPIRVAEPFPELLTEDGLATPPLVLWINRENRIAAGVILSVPKRTEGEILARQITSALGIDHAVLWLPEAMVLIQQESDSWVERANHSLANLSSEGVALARDAFGKLYNELQRVSVLGMTPATALSPAAIANICLSLIDIIQTEYRRSLLIDHDSGEDVLDRAATAESILDLLLLIQAEMSSLLPDSLLAEEMTEACVDVASKLPSDIARLYVARPVPADGKTLHRARFRLRQLGLANDPVRVADALTILLNHFASRFDCGPVPATKVMINPDSLPKKGRFISVLAPAPIALLLKLADEWSGSERLRKIVTDFAPLQIDGSCSCYLADDSKPTAEEKRAFQTILRTSWPNRRFKLPATTPNNLYQLLHLLGVCSHNDFALNAEMLSFDKGRGGRHLLDLLSRSNLKSLQLSTDGRLTVALAAEPVEGVLLVSEGQWQREIDTNLLQQGELNLGIAMLPEELFELCRRGDLVISDRLPVDKYPEELGLFMTSRLGKYLWSELVGGQPPKSVATATVQTEKMLFPSEDILQRLADRREAVVTEIDIDKGLNKLLSLDGDYVVQRKRSRSGAVQKGETATIEDRIEACLAAEGIPAYPDQYCYQFSGIEYDQFAVNVGLRSVGQFLDEYELVDDAGGQLNVSGEARANSLVLAAYGRDRQVKLPKESLLVQQIYLEYLADLKRLRAIARECGAAEGSGEGLEGAIDKVWLRMCLPPWELVSSLVKK